MYNVVDFLIFPVFLKKKTKKTQLLSERFIFPFFLKKTLATSHFNSYYTYCEADGHSWRPRQFLLKI